MTHIRAALSILACRALEAHYRRNLARVVPVQVELVVRVPVDQRVISKRVWNNAELAEDIGLDHKDFAKWECELSTTP